MVLKVSVILLPLKLKQIKGMNTIILFICMDNKT
jgi:hypothetical protein